MVLTDAKYIDGNGGLFLEYYGEEGFYNYIHINKKGKIEFLSTEINEVKGKKCTYYIDYCDSRALRAEMNLNDLKDQLKGDLNYYKDLSSLKEETKKEEEETNKNYCKNFNSDDIPF